MLQTITVKTATNYVTVELDENGHVHNIADFGERDIPDLRYLVQLLNSDGTTTNITQRVGDDAPVVE